MASLPVLSGFTKLLAGSTCSSFCLGMHFPFVGLAFYVQVVFVACWPSFTSAYFSTHLYPLLIDGVKRGRLTVYVATVRDGVYGLAGSWRSEHQADALAFRLLLFVVAVHSLLLHLVTHPTPMPPPRSALCCFSLLCRC